MIADKSFLDLRLARTEVDLHGAQRLRYRVFVEEMRGDGAGVDHRARLESDRFDAFSDHLVLIDKRRDPETLDHVVGVYRLLPGEAAAKAGGFYTESEFDLSRLKSTHKSLLELGRSCVDRDFRGGMALFMLWNGLAQYVRFNRFDMLFGVASFHGTDPAALAEPLSYLHHHHLAEPEIAPLAVGPDAGALDLLPFEQVSRRGALRAIPPLIKSYLRIGGQVGNGFFIDRAFNTLDVCMVLDTARVNPRPGGLYSNGRRGDG